MSQALPGLEVQVERGRATLRVIARGVVERSSVVERSGVAESVAETSSVLETSTVPQTSSIAQTSTYAELQATGSGSAVAAAEPTTPVLLEANFSGDERGVWFRVTQHGVTRVFSRDTVARHPALSGVLRLIADEVDGISRDRARASSQELLGFLCRSLLVYVRRMDNVVPLRGYPPLRDSRIERALELLNADISRRWTVELLARAVGLSRPVFARQFLRMLGLSPMRYLTRRRLQMAAALLLGSDAALAEVAARVGYRSEFAFSRAFRKQFQVPPGTYRQRPPTALALAPRMAA